MSLPTESLVNDRPAISQPRVSTLSLPRKGGNMREYWHKVTGSHFIMVMLTILSTALIVFGLTRLLFNLFTDPWWSLMIGALAILVGIRLSVRLFSGPARNRD